MIVNYNRSAEAAEAVAAEIGGRAVQADVSTAEGCAALVAAAEELGSFDVLVNNAGINRDGLMLRHEGGGLAGRVWPRTWTGRSG